MLPGSEGKSHDEHETCKEESVVESEEYCRVLRRHTLLRGRRATQSGPQTSGKSEMLVCTRGYAAGHWGLHASEGESRKLNLIASFIDWSDVKPERLICKTHF